MANIAMGLIPLGLGRVHKPVKVRQWLSQVLRQIPLGCGPGGFESRLLAPSQRLSGSPLGSAPGRGLHEERVEDMGEEVKEGDIINFRIDPWRG